MPGGRELVTAIQPSFAAGELSPLLFGRVDLDKYHVGLALARNCFVDYRGGLSNRPGTQFCGQAKPNTVGQPRLIPFIVNTTSAYALEFGNMYVRFWYNRAPVLEATQAITAVTQANPGVFTVPAHGYSNGDEVQLASLTGMTSLNGKSYLIAGATTNTFTLADLFFNPISTVALPAYGGGGTVARVYTLTTPYASADIPNLKYTQSANVLTITHPSYFPMNLSQVGAAAFTLSPVGIGPLVGSPTSLSGVDPGTVNSDAGYSYVVTAVSQDGKEESIVSNRVDILTDNPLTTTSNKSAQINLSWKAPAEPVSSYRIYRTAFFWSRNAGGTNKATTPNSFFGLVGQSTSTNFTDAVNTNAPDFARSPPQYNDPFSTGQLATVNINVAGGGYTGIYTTPLIFSGGGGSGAAGYVIVNPFTNKAAGVVITNFGKGYTTLPTVSDAIGTTTYTVTLGQLTGTYPSAVTYFQQRETFGGTSNLPESFVASQPGKYSNFDTSSISNASDSITASIASVQNNTIMSMTAMSTGLIVFTAGSAFLVSGGGQGTAVTPSSIVALPQASFGASALPPIPVNYDVLYSEARGSTVRDLTFNFYYQNYVGVDRSVLASHLFFGYKLQEWAFAEAPFRLVHAIRNDGTLLTMTYVPEQEVFAWTHGDTNGLFLSVCSIPEGQENAVYFIIQRYVEGSYVYYVERLASRVFAFTEDAWFLDAALALPLSSPASNLLLGAGAQTVGASVSAFASTGAAWASAAVIGDVIWGTLLGGGKATITAFADSQHVTVTINEPFPVFANDPSFTAVPIAAGTWFEGTPTVNVSGLDHLDGLMVSALADGVPVPAQVCNNGAIVLPQPATKVVAGLAYQAQAQTLKIDLGEPTQQGKRKNITAVSLRVDKTLGLKAGPNFANLVEIKDLQVPYTPPYSLVSNDVRPIIPSQWKVDGQLCFQQDYPLPFTILAIMPEVTLGDTSR
jgi:hypothetical protein